MANFPYFVFEIEESTDVTKGLLRLYQVKELNIQPIIVGPESRRSKFLAEIEKDPFYHIKREVESRRCKKRLYKSKSPENIIKEIARGVEK